MSSASAAGDESGQSALIFLGTGGSGSVPSLRCLIQPSDPPCAVCSPALSLPPEKNPNYRCNPSLLIDYRRSDGNRSYILIDVGKTFREQVLRWFTLHKIPRVDSIVLTHDHADAILGLDDVRCVQPYSLTNDVDPTPIYLTQFTMDSVATKFPYLVHKEVKEGQEVRRVAQLEWKIIEDNCEKSFVASGLRFVPLPVLHGKGYICLGFLFGEKSRVAYISDVSHIPASTEYAVKRICPKRVLIIGMSHDFDHHKDNEVLFEWSKREGILVQLAHDGLRIPMEL
ncbi:hypothetical protein TIFTF001_023658 [Ficus carica]|uniref:Metallo-beta-lactamase domain-containing protein n=1 Tax=Ficus carica TaxID=3494 RepID=A0AA88DGD5_FICCA|nr:hypothetical protein TIFTF001_023658 [Ficus carica]